MLSSFDFDLVIHVTIFIMSFVLLFIFVIFVIYSFYYDLILLSLFLQLKKT